MLEFVEGANLSLGPLLATFLLGIATLTLLILYSVQKQSIWKKAGIPYVKPYPIFGCVLEALSTPFHELEIRRYNKYGRIYGQFEGNNPLLSVGDPEIIRDILVKDFQSFTGRRELRTGDEITEKMLSIVRGDDWKRLRTIVTPTFTTGKIRRMLGVFKECSQTLVSNFKKAAEKGEPVEAKSIYGAFTMDIIASSAFSTKIDSKNDPNNKFVQTAKSVFSRNFNWRFVVFTLFPGVLKLFRVGIFPREGLNFFHKVTLDIIEERKKTGQTRNDFLQLLLDAIEELSQGKNLHESDKDDMIANYGDEQNDALFKPNVYSKKSMSHTELVAQCVIFFLAGYDTTASTLAFATYSLALNPDIQEKVIKELDNALDENNGELTYEAIQSMKYLDNVISETLRMYPPAVRLERVADEEYKVRKTGLVIPKGTLITIPVNAIHRDPEFFPDPEKFDPDRFSPEERAKRDQYSYLPFGAGPRNCVAMRFALMETKVCLAHVLSNFRVKRCAETKVPLEYFFGQGLLQPKGITVKFEVRKDTVKAL